jgi:hypothetical protein
MIKSNSTNFFKETSYEMILNVSLVIIGILGNLIAVCVFLKKKLMERHFNLYLLALTILELIFCLVLFIGYLSNTFDKNMFSTITIHIVDSCITLMTLFLSVDRLYGMRQPTKINSFITHLHAKKLIFISVFILVFLKTTSDSFCLFTNSLKFKVIYCSISSPLIFHVIPQLMVLVLNAFLVREIVKYYRNASKMCLDYINTYQIVKIKGHHLNISQNLHVHSLARHSNKNSIDNCLEVKSSMRRILNKREPVSHTHSNNHFYILILISSLWSFLTLSPYYSVQTYLSLNKLEFFNKNFNPNLIIKIKIISSILFNSNHSFNFFIYFCFHHEFRYCFKSFFSKINCRNVKYNDNIVEM